jgi:hypothetical protein
MCEDWLSRENMLVTGPFRYILKIELSLEFLLLISGIPTNIII